MSYFPLRDRPERPTRRKRQPEPKPTVTEQQVRERAKACGLDLRRHNFHDFRPRYRLIDPGSERIWEPRTCVWVGNSLSGAMEFLAKSGCA